jgi:hypothetical protein
MDIWDIVKKAGTSVLTSVIPGAGIAIDLVNSFRDADDQLPNNATGKQLEDAVKSLTPEQQAQITNRKFDLEEKRIEANVALMNAGPAHATRAWIAKWAFILVAVSTALVVIIWGKAVVWDKSDTMVKTIMDGWPFVAALLSPFILWLNRYFGILKQEQQDRLNAGNGGLKQGALTNIITAIRSK